MARLQSSGKRRQTAGPSKAANRRANRAWTALPDDELLQLRLKDLDLSIDGTWLEACVQELNKELATHDLAARAHAWISNEWFSPENTPGIAIPFYLAHPRLARLERKLIHDVEGGTRRECMRLLRHEAGHVIQHSYHLHRRPRWRAVFGKSSIPYPEQYRPDPLDKNFVQHLPRWYAQAHPDEDFAETFAVWLTPRSAWRKRYAGWPALEKLLYVDELMAQIAGETPALTKRTKVDPIGELSMTLEQHYKRKLEHYAVDTPTTFDRDLRRIFSDEPRHSAAPTASGFIRRNRAEIRRMVSGRTGEYQQPLDAALNDMATRCRAMKLRAPGSQAQLRTQITTLLTTRAVQSLYTAPRKQWFAV